MIDGLAVDLVWKMVNSVCGVTGISSMVLLTAFRCRYLYNPLIAFIPTNAFSSRTSTQL